MQSPQFRRGAAFIGIGFPLGVGAGFTYRPIQSIAFSAAINKAGQIFYITNGEATLRFSISSPLEKFNPESKQSGITACFDFYFPEAVGPDLGPLGWTSGFALLYGSMPASRSWFQWDVGIHLRFDTFLFQKSPHSIQPLPEFECSFILF